MKQTDNKQDKPLWKVLNHDILELSGKIAIFPEADKRKGIKYKVLQKELEQAKERYTRLAFINLEPLAEALEAVVNFQSGEGDVYTKIGRVVVKAQNALNSIK